MIYLFSISNFILNCKYFYFVYIFSIIVYTFYMTLSKLEQYYNKFNEDKRLLSRHGIVEFTITTKYINKLIDEIFIEKSKNYDNSKIKMIDIGAGTGRYTKYYYDKGIDISAVELVKQNLVRLKEKCPLIQSTQGNAKNLSKFQDNTFDITLLLGPMYHLFNEDKITALNEARRVTKPNGYIVVAYLLNDYAVISYAFKENNLLEVLKQNKLDENFITHTNIDDLYSYDTLNNIETYSQQCNLKRKVIFSPDGPTDYMRQSINKMDNQTFEIYLKYVEKIAERKDLLGASSHIVDILQKV